MSKRDASTDSDAKKKPQDDYSYSRPDWSGKCEVCGATPIVPATGLCGPCTFGEADTAGGNWLSAANRAGYRHIRDIQRDLELSVLKASRALRGSMKKLGLLDIPYALWQRFMNAEDALHAFHAERMKRKRK